MDPLISFIAELTAADAQPFVLVFDLLLRSLFLVFVFSWLSNKLRVHCMPASLHGSFTALLLLLALLPFAPALVESTLAPGEPRTLLLVLLPGDDLLAGPPAINGLTIAGYFLLFYLLGLTVCIARLCLALVSLARLNRQASFDAPASDAAMLEEVAAEFPLRRNPRLGYSEEITSPITFGCLSPTVLVPHTWQAWSQSEKQSVLRHELSHVARNDWLVNLISDCIVSLNWFNPLFWLVRKLARNQAELACDLAVLQRGGSRPDYADQLLRLAKNSSRKQPAAWLGASMVETGDLTERIDGILAFRRGRSATAWYIKALFLAMLLVSILATSMRLIAVERAELFRDARLLQSVQPVYSSPRIFNGLEGLTRLQYDVTAAGHVDPDSIRIIMSTDPYLLALPAIEAVKQYVFEPRIVDGRPMRSKGLVSEFSVGGYEASFAAQ